MSVMSSTMELRLTWLLMVASSLRGRKGRHNCGVSVKTWLKRYN
ncbi:hypothetical protein GLYMA_08G168666v4 [Glycine max]|nr:hypothetical protein GLYMA_08G168666v4 [Glycine max]KAH1051622.1 hypothetical protein GYH30_021496 [Glycine max]